MRPARELRKLIDRGGVVRLRPNFVHRFYPDGNRLRQPRAMRRLWRHIPERWIASSVRADNRSPVPSGGLSFLADIDVSLRDAIRAFPREVLGEELLAAHGPEFRVLVKLLDPAAPIPFHVHATDAQVRRSPRRFPGQRFGKDEAYYFVEAPKGAIPYTHAGLFDGVTRSDLAAALARGPEAALELSPSFYQVTGEGFFVPAGVPHRPGTALTLEIQQPSDVYTMLDGADRSALKMIDLNQSRLAGDLQSFRLIGALRRARGAEVATIFPREICRKFEGERLVVSSSLTYRSDRPLVLWILKGAAKVSGHRCDAGEEFFITHAAGSRGIELERCGEEKCEAFTFMPVI
ncbi:MAG: hypothetical protein ACREJC_19840 [Tepidisphaeraceae bacterium]